MAQRMLQVSPKVSCYCVVLVFLVSWEIAESEETEYWGGGDIRHFTQQQGIVLLVRRSHQDWNSHFNVPEGMRQYTSTQLSMQKRPGPNALGNFLPRNARLQQVAVPQLPLVLILAS